MRAKGSPKIALAVLLLFTVLGSTLVFLSPPVVAQAPSCGDTITASTTLAADIGPCSEYGLIIGASGITLNCAGYTILGPGGTPDLNSTELSSVAIILTGMSNVTVENCDVSAFEVGFLLNDSSAITFTTDVANNNSLCGFIYFSSENNVLSNSTADRNGYYGFAFIGSSVNTLTSNTANNNAFSNFLLFNYSNSNILTMNTADNGTFYGFLLMGGSNNTLAGNTANSNSEFGYYDMTQGKGTAGTANLYSSDKCSYDGAGGSYPGELCTLVFGGANITSVTQVTTNTHGQIIIKGSGFGNAFPQLTPVGDGSVDTGINSTIPSIAIWDNCLDELCHGSNSWQAGNQYQGAEDSIGIDFASWWNNQIVIDGFGSALGAGTLSGGVCSGPTVHTICSGDNITIEVWGPNGGPNAYYHLTVSSATPQKDSVSIFCSKSSPVVGSSIICKASVFGSSPTGTVTWSSLGNGTPLDTSCKLSRHKAYSSCSVRFIPDAAGPALLTANYGGDSKNSATSGTYDLIVTMKASRTTISCSPRSAIAGSPTVINCTAKVVGYQPSGYVEWGSSGAGSVSIAGGYCVINTSAPQRITCYAELTGAAAGIVTIEGNYSGDGNNMASSGTAKVIIKKAPTTTTLSCVPSSFAIRSSTTCTATVTGEYPWQNGTITFTVSGRGSATSPSNTCALSGGSCQVTLTATAPGGLKVKATYGGDSNNLGSSRTTKLTIKS